MTHDPSHERRPLIEIGWVVAGRLDEADMRAMQEARDASAEWFRSEYPDFEWKLPVTERPELVSEARVEPVQLLDYGVTERNARHWDFTLIITPADLVSQYKQDAVAVVSRSLQGTVISTARIDPRAYLPSIAADQRVRLMARRIRALLIHALGHLAGLEHAEDPRSFLAGFTTLEEMDRADQLGEPQASRLREAFQEVADWRLEETTDTRRVSSRWFYLRAAWINRRHIVKAVREARPWQFPFRLSRLTAAAASAMLILVITAETWEVGASQPPFFLALLSGTAIAATTLYVVLRQRLFVRREPSRLTELSVVTNVSTLAIVAFGMTTTFLLLVLVTLLLGHLFFAPDLVSRWVQGTKHPASFVSYLKLATFVASIGICTGALGASFEDNYYFRHITFIDEEI